MLLHQQWYSHHHRNIIIKCNYGNTGFFPPFIFEPCSGRRGLNPLPSHNILDQSYLKDFADDKINVTNATNFIIGKEENIMGKGENAGYQHCLLFP